MSTFEDTDQLRAYLATLKTYEEFWEKKEPDLFDAREKAWWDQAIATWGDNPDDYLEPLKQTEVRRFVREQQMRQGPALN